MKNLLSPLKRIIFLSFILFTIFAGKGCGDGDELNESGQENSGGEESIPSKQINTPTPTTGSPQKSPVDQHKEATGASAGTPPTLPDNQKSIPSNENQSIEPLQPTEIQINTPTPTTGSPQKSPVNEKDKTTETPQKKVTPILLPASLFEISSSEIEDYKKLKENIRKWINKECIGDSNRVVNLDISQSTNFKILIKAILNNMQENIEENKNPKLIIPRYRQLFIGIPQRMEFNINLQEKLEAIESAFEDYKNQDEHKDLFSSIKKIIQEIVRIKKVSLVNKKFIEDIEKSVNKQTEKLINCIEEFANKSSQ